MPRTVGHKRGSEAARKIVTNAAELGVEYITLFGFSSENWSRPEDEVSALMGLLRHYLKSETAELHKNNARLTVIGERDAFSEEIRQLIENAERLTADNTGVRVIVALNYGGRADISRAVLKMMQSTDKVPSTLKDVEAGIQRHLMTADIPDPDLLIRTSGEQRISNFLLWQCAYAEMVFTETLWPDFGMNDLKAAIQEYQSRDRRFGAISSQ